jgi:RNA polymerase sigma-70 factor (ECF subfamily)
MDDETRPEAGHFQTTAWSLVHRAADPRAGRHRESLEELLRRYWPAMRAHLVAIKRIDAHDADDLVQGFIREKVLEGNLLSGADQSRGKFRTLLLTALDRYVVDQHRRRGARKRRFENGAAELEARHGAAGAAADVFDVAWARASLQEALGRMRAECDAKGRADLWAVFEHRVVGEALGGTPSLPYEEMVQRYGFRSPAQASNALMTAKRMFARVLRSVLAEYTQGGDEQAVEEELRDLQRALEHGARHPAGPA